jgi:hypothetical protein
MNLYYEPYSKLKWQGVHVSRHLSFGRLRKAIREYAMVANRTREIRPSGMTPGACGNVDYGSRIEAQGEIFGFATEP